MDPARLQTLITLAEHDCNVGALNHARDCLVDSGIVSSGMHDSMPVAVQIVGRRFREDLILNALEAIEARVGWAQQ